MFNLQGSEIIIVLLLALVVLGPEKLPDAMRKAGKAYSELKKMSTGFQTEFRAAVDEPLREIRDTANVLRDSADFTKLQDGSRTEKPKSAEMAAIGEEGGPTADVPTFETPTNTEDDGPAIAADSEPPPFAADDEPPVRPGRADVTAPPPFSGMSSAAPRPEDTVDASAASETTPSKAPKPGGPFSGESSAAPRQPSTDSESLPESTERDDGEDVATATAPPDATIAAPDADMVVSQGDSSEQGDR